MRSNPNPAEPSESLFWTFDGKLRMTAALTFLLAVHLLTSIMVVHLLARTDTAAPKYRTALRPSLPGTMPVAQIAKAHE
jgi:hypothetical protein